MRKYWKLIVLTTVIIVTISSMYIRSTIEASHYPSYTIKHINGDKSEIEPVTIHANYETRESFIYPEISTEGTSYGSTSTYLALLKGEGIPPEIKDLQKKYRNFMRGKEEDMSQYVETDEIVAYADIAYSYSNKQNEYSFDLAVLDRQSNKTKSFTIPVTISEKHDYVYIQDIQFVNGELKIFTINDLTTDVDQQVEAEIHLYSVDLEAEELIKDEVIEYTATHNDPDQYISTYKVSSENEVKSNQYIVYAIEVNRDAITEEDTHEYEVLENQFFAYNLARSEQEEIVLPKGYSKEAEPILYEDSMLYFLNETETDMEVISYDLDEQKVKATHKFAIPEMEAELTSEYELQDGKIYIVHPESLGKIDASIIVGDLTTGEILYEGEIRLDPSKKVKEANDVYIDMINVTKE